MGLFFLSACSPKHQDEVDRLNQVSYSYHYRNLDSAKVYAERALRLASDYPAGQAEAYNNLAFVSIAKMNYPQAHQLLERISHLTDNQVELLIGDIQLMRLCQRESKNKDFYDFKERAARRRHRIEEEQSALSDHQRRRMIYAVTEFDIVTSTYFYYVGLKGQSIKALADIDPMGAVQQDTAQYLNYLYNVGSGGIITAGTQEEINQTEFDYLMRCYIGAVQAHYPYWEANSMEALSEHLQSDHARKILIRDNHPSIYFLNVDNMPDSLLAGNLAQRALDIFLRFGDVYQTAGAYRTLAECYWDIKDYQSALICLQDALNRDTVINRAPDLVASIREQLCLVYSAVDDKPHSDYNRNIYLDLQEQTRQDRQLEARAGQLDQSSNQLNWMIAAVILAILLVVFLLFVFDHMRRKSDRKYSLETFLQPLEEWKQRNEQQLKEQSEQYEEVLDELSVARLHVENGKKRNLEQRAKISLVNSIMPFIDRIIHEVHKLNDPHEPSEVRKERYEYVAELTDKINDYNSVLTEWIQLRQGELSLHIESFDVQSLFDIVKKGRLGFSLKGVDLVVEPTKAVVKADKTLTLFMINTLADNARKFTNAGGKVLIRAQESADDVEISIQDTGQGMTEEQVAHLFDHKPIIDSDSGMAQKSHGFGLMNCKGIIDKYKKLSKIFDVCSISASSVVGQGSRFSIHLPKGVARIFLILLLNIGFLGGMGARPLSSKVVQKHIIKPVSNAYLNHAAMFADSAYFSNINGHYERTLQYADSVRIYLNRFYLTVHPKGKDLMVGITRNAGVPAEIKWFRDTLPVNYQVILDMRNESAVAALALHRWSLYSYNNKVYTQLFRESSADNTLSDYVRVMQKSENSKTVSVILLVILLIMIIPAYYFLYYRHRLYYRICIDRINKINGILLSRQSHQEKLHHIHAIWDSRDPSLEAQFPVLNDVVRQIEEALRSSIQAENAQTMSMELAKDECKRKQLEDAKLHVSNSVLDNCLSTLKHETMYYPSRIRQLIDGTDDHLEAMNEVVVYYKELYSLLSAQAQRQVESVKLTCAPVELSAVLPKSFSLRSPSVTVMGDGEMLRYLFELLQKLSGERNPVVDISEKGSRYVMVKVTLPSLALTEEQCVELFTPSTLDIHYLLCRQMIRDMGEATNARGCGIGAKQVATGGTEIDIVMAHKIESNNDHGQV